MSAQLHLSLLALSSQSLFELPSPEHKGWVNFGFWTQRGGFSVFVPKHPVWLLPLHPDSKAASVSMDLRWRDPLLKESEVEGWAGVEFIRSS